MKVVPHSGSWVEEAHLEIKTCKAKTIYKKKIINTAGQETPKLEDPLLTNNLWRNKTKEKKLSLVTLRSNYDTQFKLNLISR